MLLLKNTLALASSLKDQMPAWMTAREEKMEADADEVRARLTRAIHQLAKQEQEAEQEQTVQKQLRARNAAYKKRVELEKQRNQQAVNALQQLESRWQQHFEEMKAETKRVQQEHVLEMQRLHQLQIQNLREEARCVLVFLF